MFQCLIHSPKKRKNFWISAGSRLLKMMLILSCYRSGRRPPWPMRPLLTEAKQLARQLHLSMGLNSRVMKHKKVLVTSANAGEGKSFISNNLALSLASSGKKVALVDFDFRNPKTTSLFELTGSNGLAEFFENEEMSV